MNVGAVFPTAVGLYQSNESGRDEIYVQPFRTGGRTQISTAGGTAPKWPVTDVAFHLDSSNRVTSVEVVPKGEPRARKSSAIVHGVGRGDVRARARWPAVPDQRNHEASVPDHHRSQLEAAVTREEVSSAAETAGSQ
jgi:hypothetical protein